MAEKTLVYKAPKAMLSKSSLYAVSIFTKTVLLAAKLLAEGTVKKITPALVDEYLKVFNKIHLGGTGTNVYVTGEENLLKNEPVIYMSNHESWMDIPAMFAAVPGSLRMIAKEGLTKFPILGHAMNNAGFIAIDRKNRHKAIGQLNLAKQRLQEGISIWMAPEGTRTRNGVIGPFKKGGFYLAVDLNIPIIPVCIEGAREVMPADGMVVNTNRDITVHFLPAVSTAGFNHKNLSELLDIVRGRIVDKHAEIMQQEAEK
jgi:1-acyl-sn-glycerol-3-phosphate acyltransferase